MIYLLNLALDDDMDDFEEEGNNEEDPDLRALMSQMDTELMSQPNISSGFEKGASTESVDLDFNLVKNLLESYASQNGLAGPVSNILGDLKSK